MSKQLDDKQSNLSLYVLIFKKKPIIKIGLSTNLVGRIEHFRKEYQDEFNLVNSYLIGCYQKSRIKSLENELKVNTKDLYSLTGEHFNFFKDKDGFSELRSNKSLDLILKLIHSKHEHTNAFYIHKGISLERNLKSSLPESIYSESGETNYKDIGVAEKLLNCIRENSDDERKTITDEELLNSILYDYIKIMEFKIEIEKATYVRAKDMYYARKWSVGNWYWKRPSDLVKEEN